MHCSSDTVFFGLTDYDFLTDEVERVLSVSFRIFHNLHLGYNIYNRN